MGFSAKKLQSAAAHKPYAIGVGFARLRPDRNFDHIHCRNELFQDFEVH